MLDSIVTPTDLPPGLEEPPAGWFWHLDGGTYRLLPHGDPVRGRMEQERADAQREAQRAALAQQAAEQQRAADTLAAIAHRAAPILAASDGQNDDALRVVTAGVTPARVALHRCISQIAQGRAAHDQAVIRRRSYLDAETRRQSAADEVQRFERAIQDEFDAWSAYGSSTPQPDPRTSDRETLQARLAALTWEAELAGRGGDEMDVAVAESVVTTLEGRLEGLRHDLLVESTLPLALDVISLTQQIADRYKTLVALGVVTGGAKSVKCALPALPHGTAGFEIGAADVADQIALWRAAEAALEGNPNTPINVPGMPEEPPTGPASGRISRLRRAIERARG
jgi:hypothetical protein